MAGKRLGVLVGLFLTVVLATASPTLALPDCAYASEENCHISCLNYFGTACKSWSVGQCVGQAAVLTYKCQGGPNNQIQGQCGCGGGCFLAGTPITMGDGSTKPIEKIQVGDVVLAYDETTKTMKPDAVRTIHPAVEVPFHLVVNGSMLLTPNHRVLSKGQWVEIGQLTVGDTLTAPDGKAVPIAKMEKIDGTVTVYNFAVNPYETYVANGVIVHNRKEE